MPRPPTNSTRTNLYLPDKLTDAYRKIAQKRGISFSELVRTAMFEYLQAQIAKSKK